MQKPEARKKPVTPASTGKIDLATLKGTIVFVSDRGGSLKIWSMHASGKNAKQLTKSEGADADPRFSPDGKRILYTTLRGGFPEIWLMNRDGSEPKFVTKGSQGNWAPDGKIDCLHPRQPDLRPRPRYRQGTARHAEDLGTLRRPRLQPRRQTHRRRQPASRQHRHLPPRVSTARSKANSRPRKPAAPPAWSKDGKRILCQTDKGHIHEVGIDGKGDEQLTFGADVQHDARYSPDGKMILFCRAPNAGGRGRSACNDSTPRRRITS